MSKIYAIEQGIYSDYHVVGVYSTRENAEAVLAKLLEAEPYDKPTIEEWELDPAADAIRAGLSLYRVWMQKDGTVDLVRPDDALSGYDLGGELTIQRDSRVAGTRKTPRAVLYGCVWAESDQHAVKIVNEHRAQLIAMNQWEEA